MIDKEAKTDSPIHELLRRRWSPRAYSDLPVEPEKLRSVLEAARWAPSSFNEQPWAFLVATREQPQEHARMLSVLVDANQAWAKAAPVLLLSVARLNFDRDGRPNRYAAHDVGLATAQLLLQATALGLAGHAMAGFHVEKARELFGIPAAWEPMAAIALGYPGDPDSLSEAFRKRELEARTRKPLEQFVFSERWGHPAPLAVTSSSAPLP